MADFKTEINEIKVLGKIETTEVKATILGYSNPGKQGLSAYDVAVNEGFVGSEEQWLLSLIGPAGQDGREIELRKTDTFVQWKYVDDINWTNLIALSELKGPQGNTGLQGPDGPVGPQGNTGEPGYTPQKGTDYFDGLDVTWKGTYTAETQYQINDAVFYEGSSYICILESLGNLPTNTMYFNIMAQQGQAGEGSGDMLASVYDPDGKQANAFDYENFKNTPTFKTINEQSVLGTGNLEIIGVEDGDKGDVVVSDDGETWTIDNGVVTNEKLANMNIDTVKGRISSLGAPQDLTAEQVRTMINVEDGSQVNNIIELEELPTASSEYIDNLYKIDDKLYVCVAETTLKHIEVGDNLNSKRLIFNFPDEGAFNQEADTRYKVISCNATNYIEHYYRYENPSHSWYDTVDIMTNDSPYGIRMYEFSFGGVIDNHSYYVLPSDFGVVTSIRAEDTAYQYIRLEETVYEWVEYGGSIPDNLITSSDESVNDWITVDKETFDNMVANEEIEEGKMYNVIGDSFVATSSTPVGGTMIWPGLPDKLPANYMLCEGQSLNKIDYPTLYDRLGNTYGSTDTTFNLPNIKGRIVVHLNSEDTEFDTLGETSGSKTHTLTNAQVPATQIYDDQNNAVYFRGNVAQSGTNISIISRWGNAADVALKVNGSGEAHNNLQPYIVGYYIIKVREEAYTEDLYNLDKKVSTLNYNVVTDGPPVKTGRKIDGKDEYVKRISLGTMPNATTKTVDTGLTATNITIIELKGTAKNSAGTTIVLPFVHTTSDSGIMMTFESTGDISLITGTDRSGFTGHCNIYFTYN